MTADHPRDGRHRCPECGNPTTYQAFSGGREWYCEVCDMNGFYPDEPDAESPQPTAGAPDPVIDDLAERALDARSAHVFVDTTTCACGFQPPMSSDWERHRMAVALAAVVPLIRAQVAAGLVAVDPADQAGAHAPRMTHQTDVDRAAEEVLVEHQRMSAAGCLCGWSELGRSHPGHQAAKLREAGLLAAGTRDKQERSEEHVIDMGFLSLPAEIQAEAECSEEQR